MTYDVVICTKLVMHMIILLFRLDKSILEKQRNIMETDQYSQN